VKKLNFPKWGWFFELAALFALLALPVRAQEVTTIEGQVINASGDPVAWLPVVLQPFQGIVPLEPQRALTDAEGRFTFANLPAGAERSYRLQTTYQGVEYTSDLLMPDPAQGRLKTTLQVYEATENAAISVTRQHIFIDFERGALMVRELYIFGNAEDRTYIGQFDQTLGRRVTVRLTLPVEAQSLSLESGGEYVELPGGIGLTSPVPPGAQFSPVMLVYKVPYQSDTMVLTRTISYPTAALNVLINNVGAVIESEQLSDQGLIERSGQSYRNLVGTNLAAGQEVVLRFSHLPGEEVGLIPLSEASGGVVSEGTDSLLWLVPVLGAIAAVGGLGYALRRRAAIMPAPTARGRKQEKLLQALASLDDAHAAGELDDDAYIAQRAILKAELLAMLRKSQVRNR